MKNLRDYFVKSFYKDHVKRYKKRPIYLLLAVLQCQGVVQPADLPAPLHAVDNAAMESCFNLLQKNVLDRQVWATREQLRIAIVTWIEGIYNRRRRQRRLGKQTPTQFETLTTAAQAA